MSPRSISISSSPRPRAAFQSPARLPSILKDDHLQYAITWFALAFAVVIAFGVWWRGQHRAS